MTAHVQRLYEELCVARDGVVKAALAHLFAGGPRADLADSLMIERLAKHRFEAAIRAERQAAEGGIAC